MLVWPDNEKAWRLFERVRGRWEYAPLSGTRLGLKWEAIYPLIDHLCDDKDDWLELAQQLEVMEVAVMDPLLNPFPTES